MATNVAAGVDIVCDRAKTLMPPVEEKEEAMPALEAMQAEDQAQPVHHTGCPTGGTPHW